MIAAIVMIGSAYPHLHLHLSRDAAVLKSTERLCKPRGDATATLVSERLSLETATIRGRAAAVAFPISCSARHLLDNEITSVCARVSDFEDAGPIR